MQLKKLDLDFTRACNLNCAHCFADAHTAAPDELSTAEIKRVLAEAAPYKPDKVVIGLGGEAFLRKDLFDILEECHRLGLSVVLATNGLLLTEERARKLAALGVRVSVSLDGAYAKTHDELRRLRGAFGFAIRAVKRAKAAGCKVGVNMTMTKHNYRELGPYLALCKKLGVDWISIGNIMPFGRALEHPEMLLGDKEYYEIVNEAIKHRNLGIPITSFDPILDILFQLPSVLSTRKFTRRGCGAGHGNVGLKVNGDVWPCTLLPFKAGNVREKPLASILGSPVFAEVHDRVEARYPECQTCEARAICPGGCPASYLVAGVNSTMCSAMKYIYKHLTFELSDEEYALLKAKKEALEAAERAAGIEPAARKKRFLIDQADYSLCGGPSDFGPDDKLENADATPPPGYLVGMPNGNGHANGNGHVTGNGHTNGIGHANGNGPQPLVLKAESAGGGCGGGACGSGCGSHEAVAVAVAAPKKRLPVS